MTNWSDKFNNLSPEIRKIGSAGELQLRIQHLNFEKKRLRERYFSSVREINDHIMRCGLDLEKLEKELKD